MPNPSTDGSRGSSFLRSVAGYSLVRVRGRSMAPTLLDGDVLVVRVGVQPRVGALVVAKLPDDRPLGIKRVYRHDGEGWWLERDNPSEGTDSWMFGAVPDEDVVAVVRRRIWPFRRRSLAG